MMNKQTEALKMEWISVDEKLPEFVTVTSYEEASDDILLLLDGKHVFIGAYIFDKWSKTDDFCMRDLDGGYEVVEGMKVTHWMPLPSAPNEINTHPAPQPAQEPVAWADLDMWLFDSPSHYYNGETPSDWTPLYTHPAPSWQGLSDDDMSIIFDKFDWKEVEIAGEYLDLFKFARAIEQALKEKNTDIT